MTVVCGETIDPNDSVGSRQAVIASNASQTMAGHLQRRQPARVSPTESPLRNHRSDNYHIYLGYVN
jgi:hypothetical protein